MTFSRRSTGWSASPTTRRFNAQSAANGELMTIYNLNPAKQGQVDLLDTTADRSKAGLSFKAST